jgi:hypothetical protein
MALCEGRSSSSRILRKSFEYVSNDIDLHLREETLTSGAKSKQCVCLRAWSESARAEPEETQISSDLLLFRCGIFVP